MERRNIVKGILWFLTGMALVVAAARFTRGLGATTNLTDSTPWGFWIGFDVMAGVALAAGGFVMAAIVYIFRFERFHSFARPAVLTAFLGYLAVAIGLTFDLGVPWNIWHPMIFWQYHSVLFEVAMCVMLYLTVLALEFAPAALEHKLAQRWSLLGKAYALLKKATIPLVITGIALSTLHQSSLGSLFILMPYRVHPLWYSPGIMLPVNFFVSAIALGFMMVTLEHYVSAWVYKHQAHTHLLEKIGRPAAMILLAYLAFRIGDLWNRGVLPGALDGSWQSWLFVAELLISAAIPAAILLTPALRKSGKGLFAASLMAVMGMVMYRLDIAIVTMKKWPGMSYFPSMVELMVSIGIVAGLALVFMYFVENLNLFPETMTRGRKRELETTEETLSKLPEGAMIPRGVVTGTVDKFMARWYLNWEPFQKPSFSLTTRSWFGDPLQDGIRRWSMVLIVAVALTAAALPENAVRGFNYEATPVEPALPAAGGGGEVLRIDGNRAREMVLFDHADHQKRLGEKESCSECHHMDYPEAAGTPCAYCHSDMYLATPAFDHKSHQDEFGGNNGCVECHPVNKDPANAKSCAACHREMYPEAAETERVDYMALSYKDALHGNCEDCHRKEAEKRGEPKLGQCAVCHGQAAE